MANNLINRTHLGQHVVQAQWLRCIVSVIQSSSGLPGGPVIIAVSENIYG